MSWHVGMKVVCVEPFGHLVKGRVYVVSELLLSFLLPGIPHIRVEGDPQAWMRRRFRPVQSHKTNISIFTAMLNPQKQVMDA